MGDLCPDACSSAESLTQSDTTFTEAVCSELAHTMLVEDMFPGPASESGRLVAGEALTSGDHGVARPEGLPAYRADGGVVRRGSQGKPELRGA